MARKWYNGKGGSSYTSVVFESGVSKNGKHQLKGSFQIAPNKWCTVVVYDESQYEPSVGKHAGKACFPGSVSVGSFNKTGGGSSFPLA